MCNKSFSRHNYLAKHILICKKANNNNTNIDITGNSNIAGNENTINNNTKNDNSINIDNDNSINIDNSIKIDLNFKLCEFGKENYDNIDRDNLFKEGYVFVNLVKELHFNPNVEENHNILLTDQTRTKIKVIENEEWQTKSIEDVLKKIVSKTYIYLDKLKKKVSLEYSNIIEKEIKQFILNELDSYTNEHKIKLNNRISNLIYDDKDITKKIYNKHKISKKIRADIQNRNKKYNKKNVIVETDSSDSDSE